MGSLAAAEAAARAIAAALRHEVPPGCGFAIVLCDYGLHGFTTYISTLDRAGTVRVFRDLANKIEAEA